MTRTSDLLVGVRVKRTCGSSWELMTGDDRVRFCEECRRNVYNISSMTTSEAETLLSHNVGRICIRFERGADDRIVTAPEPVALPIRRFPAHKLASAVTAVLLSASVGASTPNDAAPATVIQKTVRPRSGNSKQARKHSVRALTGTVTDPMGGRIARATVIVEQDGKRFKQMVAT